jgi:hypothetical protein
MSLGPDEPPAGPWRVVRIAQVTRLLLRATGDPAGRPRIVAVDGRSGGGKTTTAGVLSAAVPRSAVVHTDDIAWNHSFFGWSESLCEGVLDPLRHGEAVSYRPPAWAGGGRPGEIVVAAGMDVVFVEGVGAARRELMSRLDAVIWVQSDLAQAQRRGIARDGGDRAAADFWQKWMAEEVPFLADQRPWERADVVVAGTPVLPYDAGSELVVAMSRDDGRLREAGA